MSFLHAFVGFDGRIGRLTYFLGSMLLLAVVIALAMGLIAFYGVDYGKTPEETRTWTLWSVVLDLVLLYPMLAITTRRLHDIDLSGRWNVAFWVPTLVSYTATLAGLTGTTENPNRLGDVLDWFQLAVGVAWLVLCLIPGTRGANRFGPDPFETQRPPIPAGTAA